MGGPMDWAAHFIRFTKLHISMSVTIKVKSTNAEVRGDRQRTASRVVAYFGDNLPASNVLCFLDDSDSARLGSESERGRYEVIHDGTRLSHLPEYIVDHIFADYGLSVLNPQRVVDDFILLYGSTCAHEIGLAMTLAHELQHAIQHYCDRKIWAVNSIVNQLEQTLISSLKLTWTDIPIERQARIVSKRVAVHLFGAQPVTEYIDLKIRQHVSDGDFADWQFVRTLDPSSSLDLTTDTRSLFQRLKGNREELEVALQRKKRWNQDDFGDIDLNEFLVV
jgi:hypothetical protein